MDLSTDPALLLKFDDLGFFFFFFLFWILALAWILLKCYTASVNIYNTEEWSRLLHLRVKHGVKALETEEELPWRDIILSLTPTVFTASADLEGLLQCFV